MNKQSIVFLTLFSFILVLSIYYVTLTEEPENDLLVSGEQVTVSSGISALQDELDKKHSQNLETYNAIIASDSSDSTDKQNAVAQVNEINKTKGFENSIVKTLTDIGYREAFAEIIGDVVKVTVRFEEATNKEVVEIIDIVKTIVGKDYLVEVNFS